MDKNSSGVFIQRITKDTEKVSAFFYESLDSLRNLLSNVGALFATLFIDWRVFLYYLFVSIVLSTLHIIKTKRYGKKDMEYHKKSENVSSLISELVRGEKDIKMLNSQESFMLALEKNIEEQNQKRLEMQKLKSAYNCVISALTKIFEFILIILLIFLINNGSLTVAIAIVLFNYKSGIMTIIMEKLSTLLELLKTFDNSCNRIFSILEDKAFQKEIFGNKHLDKAYGNFEFKNVTFGYNENCPVLKNINFKINNGEMVGFVGKSGARKNYNF